MECFHPLVFRLSLSDMSCEDCDINSGLLFSSLGAAPLFAVIPTDQLGLPIRLLLPEEDLVGMSLSALALVISAGWLVLLA